MQQVLMKHEQQVHETMRRKKDTHEQVNALNEHVKLLQHQNGVQKNEMVHLKKMVTRLEGRLDEIQRGGDDWQGCCVLGVWRWVLILLCCVLGEF